MSDMTPEKAQALLDGATPVPLAVCEERTGWMTITGLSFKIGAPLYATDLTREDRVQRLADARLIAAAPDLARTVIAQAAEITRLRAKVEAAEKLAEAARERDGGTHDDDCKALRYAMSSGLCNCGKDALDAALSAYEEAGK